MNMFGMTDFCDFTFVLVSMECSLRSPKTPDGNSDMGKHSFSYGIMPHEGMYMYTYVYQLPLSSVSLTVTIFKV